MKNISNNIIVALLLCITHYSFSQTFTKINERTKQIIDSTYNALIKKYKAVGVSIAIVDNGEIVYATGYGFSDKTKQVKADEKTIYRIGSCTKSFTALSLMQLHEKGLLNVNHSIKNYLTDLKITSRFNDNNQFFIKDILTHTSGLPCDISNGFFCDAPPPTSWLINELNKQTTITPRNYLQAYSNVGYGLLGELIERVSRTSYSNYVKEHVFEPLQMTSSYIDYDEKLASNFSKAYLNNKEVKEPLIRDKSAGLIHSNVLDMANYVKMYLNGGSLNNTRIVSENSLKVMERNHLDSLYLPTNEDWGYGLYTQTALMKGEKDSMVIHMIGHGGDTYAFHSDFGFVPELNVGVVILTNSNSRGNIRSARKLLKLYIKETKQKTLTFDYQDPNQLKIVSSVKQQTCSETDIIGTYNLGPLIISVKNTKKIKFKQGPASITMTQKKTNPNAYSLKAIVYKVMPIKLKDQEAQFVKIDGDIYFKQVDTKSKEEMYAAIKSTPAVIPNTWKAKYGNYKIMPNFYKVTEKGFANPEGTTVCLSEKNGFVTFKIKSKSDGSNTLFLNVLSSDMAVMGGIGRGTGETVRILENGNIYYSGFEFSRVK